MARQEIEYPQSDNEPIAESDFQREPLIYAIDVLQHHFQDLPDVYVSGNLFLYYEEGNPKSVVVPDVFVVIGVENKRRRFYKVWEENDRVPDFILENTSKSTYYQDQGMKRGLYALLGVREYFQFDPTHDYLEPPLQGFRLKGRNYEKLTVSTSHNGVISLLSQVLNLELHVEDETLRFYDRIDKRRLPTYQEAVAILEQKIDARIGIQKRIAELEAQLAALRGESKA